MRKQKLNWILYLFLGILSIGIISLSLLVKTSTELFTIISGIGCGAFASVIIAFLIELVNVFNKNRKNISIFESYFCNLYFSFVQLLSSFKIACNKENRENVGELFWFEWLEKMAEEQSVASVASLKEFLIGKLEDAEKQFIKIEENKLLLLGQDLLEDTEIISLMEIKLDLSVIKEELKVSKTNWENIKLIIPELKEHIGQSKVLKKFNCVSYKDGLQKLLFIRCYL